MIVVFFSCRSNHQMCSIKKVFLKILQNSQENACARVPFFIKLHASTCNFIKKEALTQIFSHEFYKIFKKPFFTGHLWTTASAVGTLLNPLIKQFLYLIIVIVQRLFGTILRSSRWGCSVKKAVLRNFATYCNFIKKKLQHRCLFFCKYCEIFKNTYIEEHLRTDASLFLKITFQHISEVSDILVISGTCHDYELKFR